MYITPWDNLTWASLGDAVPTHLEADHVIGFQIVVADFDEDAFARTEYSTSLYADGAYTVFGTMIEGCSADEFADRILIPCNVEDCGSAPDRTVVEVNSWSRIKASFR